MRLILLTIALLLVFPVSADATDITLVWNANTEADLAGYKIYYKIDGAGEPYDGTISDQGSSPITITLADDQDPDPDKVQFSVTGLPELTPPERYRFVVTAYDNEETDPPGGLESGYSNEVDTDGPPVDPIDLKRKGVD